MQRTLHKVLKVALYAFLAAATFLIVFLFGESKRIGKIQKGSSMQLRVPDYAYADVAETSGTGDGGSGGTGGGDSAGTGGGDGGSSSG